MLASLGPVVIAAVSALLMTHLLNGGQAPLYIVTLLDPPLPSQYGLMALLEPAERQLQRGRKF